MDSGLKFLAPLDDLGSVSSTTILGDLTPSSDLSRHVHGIQAHMQAQYSPKSKQKRCVSVCVHKCSRATAHFEED